MKPKEKPGRDGRVSLRLLVIAVSLAVPLLVLGATTGPAWWYNPSLTPSGTPLISGTANDYAAVNQGQVKNLAVTAVNELNTDLAQFGGAGQNLNNLALSLTATSTATNDFAAVNLGQLKALAQPFYDWLLTVGYTQGPLASGTYPWIASGLAANDYAVANIGQAKNLFSFDVTYSSAGNGIPDWWVGKYFPTLTDATLPPYALWSGSQVTILQAYQNGWNPIDYYNGQVPTLTIISGNNQTGAPGGFAPSALIVSVSNQGSPMVNAPVTFTVTSGGGGLKTSYMAGPVKSISLLTNQNGQAIIYFQFPAANSNTSTISAAAGSTGAQAQQLFGESTDNGSGAYSSPFAPSNGSVVRNLDGSLDVSWQNNTDDPSPIPISLQQPDGSWKVVTTVPAGTTHVHIPAQ
jgi:hypothetical protein